MILVVGMKEDSFMVLHATAAYSFLKQVVSSRTTFSTGPWLFRRSKMPAGSSSRRSPKVKDPLLSLAPTELNALAASIRSGRVTLPCSSHSLQRVVATADGDSISRRLEALATLGMSREAMSACLELVAQSVASRPPLEDLVNLVTTGPEAGGVANRSTGVVVAELFRSAQRSVLVAGYAIYQGQKVFQSLADRMKQNPGLQVRMFLDVPRTHGDTLSINDHIARFVHTFKTSQWPHEAPMPDVYRCGQIMDPQNGKARISACPNA